MKMNKGITLIALVVTIVVLLILAAVSISMLGGENGIITQAQNATVKNDNGTVSEALRLKLSEYILDNEGKNEEDKLGLLKKDGIINDESIINVEKLVGEKLKTGNGSDSEDVYKIEDNHLYYYDKNGNKTDLGDLGDLGSLVEETDPSLFEVDENGTISLKDYDRYYRNEIEWTIENVVIPREIDGKVVKRIGPNLFRAGSTSGGSTSKISQNIKSIIIPDTVTIIESEAFSRCINLENIEIPNSVTEIGQGAFYRCSKLTYIYIPNSVITISESAFRECDLLTNIIIGKSEELFIEGEPWGADNANVIYFENILDYNNFMSEFLKNKTKDDLEELILKSEHFLGTFEQYLIEENKTREELENEALNLGMSYNEFLQYILKKKGLNSWIYIEYSISAMGYGEKNEKDLEDILINDIIGLEEFNTILEEQGITKEELFDSRRMELGLRNNKDLFKFLIVVEGTK